MMKRCQNILQIAWQITLKLSLAAACSPQLLNPVRYGRASSFEVLHLAWPCGGDTRYSLPPSIKAIHHYTSEGRLELSLNGVTLPSITSFGNLFSVAQFSRGSKVSHRDPAKGFRAPPDRHRPLAVTWPHKSSWLYFSAHWSAAIPRVALASSFQELLQCFAAMAALKKT